VPMWCRGVVWRFQDKNRNFLGQDEWHQEFENSGAISSQKLLERNKLFAWPRIVS
jgi:hypothetical protein